MRKDRAIIFFTIAIALVACSTQPVSETTSLHLNNRKLSAIPDSVFTLTKLEYLSLGNSFVMYPPLSALGNGSYHNDSLNRIQEIPEAIGNLQHLKALDLSANDIQNLPESLIKLKKLERLELCFNLQFDVMTQLQMLKQMTWLKTLNIAATKNAAGYADILRKALPGTKVIATMEEMTIPVMNEEDNSKRSQ